jgi:hypothetical protein
MQSSMHYMYTSVGRHIYFDRGWVVTMLRTNFLRGPHDIDTLEDPSHSHER